MFTSVPLFGIYNIVQQKIFHHTAKHLTVGDAGVFYSFEIFHERKV